LIFNDDPYKSLYVESNGNSQGKLMKLFFSPTSPFARKVMVVAHEKGTAEEIERIEVAVSPVLRNEQLVARNPIGKVPCLVLDDGRAFVDSRVIAAYLDSISLPHLNPDAGPDRFDALTLEALADGLVEASILVRYETTLRPADRRWDKWHDGQMAKVDGVLKTLEANWARHLAGPVTIGVIAVGCALGYLDFRFADKDWRRAHPRLAAFFARFGERPSMRATRPTG
jgi:glutathione S-transferase